jgi:hypothetical protein
MMPSRLSFRDVPVGGAAGAQAEVIKLAARRAVVDFIALLVGWARAAGGTCDIGPLSILRPGRQLLFQDVTVGAVSLGAVQSSVLAAKGCPCSGLDGLGHDVACGGRCIVSRVPRCPRSHAGQGGDATSGT